VQNKWSVYGLVVMLGVSSVAPAQAFFNPGRWMNPSEWFGNNNYNYGPPPRPMPPQAYPPAYGQPAPYAYPAPTPVAPPIAAPAPVAPPVVAPAPFAPAAAAPAPIATPPTTYTAPTPPPKYIENNPVFAPSTSSSGLKWPDEKFVVDSPQSNQNFSFAPSGYLQGSDGTK